MTTTLVSSRRKSCTTCIVAKAKCTIKADCSVCDRCARLSKSCLFDVSVPTPAKKRKATRVEELEQKVESLVALLTTTTTTTTTSSSNADTSRDETHIPTPATTANSPASTSATSSAPATAPSQTTFDTTDSPDYIPESLISRTLAESHLARFKSQKTFEFPFVVIPPGMRASELRTTRPMLFLAIMISFSENEASVQETLLAKMVDTIALRVLKRSERSLEIVQALLVYMSWYHFHSPATYQLSVLRNVVSALVTELSLDRHVGETSGTLLNLKTDVTCGKMEPPIEVAGSPAAKRAYLGAFYLSNSSNLFRRQVAVMKHTKWTDECWKSLKELKEYDTDLFIEPMIRTQILLQQILQMPESLYSSGEMVLQIVMHNFRQTLTEIESIVPPNPPITLRMMLRAIPAFMNEGAVFAHEHQHSRSSVTGSPSHLTHAQQIMIIATTCKDVVKDFIALPYTDLCNVAMIATSMLWYSVLMLTKIMTLPASPTWDPSLIMKSAKCMDLAQALLDTCRQLSEQSGGFSMQRGVFGYWSQLVSRVAGIWSNLATCKTVDIDMSKMTTPQEFSELTERAEQIKLAGQTVQMAQRPAALEAAEAVQGTAIVGGFTPAPMEPGDFGAFNEAEWQRMLDEFAFFPYPESRNEWQI